MECRVWIDVNGAAKSDYIQRIREKTSNRAYEEAKVLKKILREISTIAHDVVEKVSWELGRDWDKEQSGYKLTNETFEDGLSLVNNVNPRLRTYTQLRAYFTGNELVILVIENDVSRELFRQAFAGGINWQQFRNALREHYLREVAGP